MLRLESVILPKLRCKCLTLKLGVSKSNMYGIASLLQNLPRLESLNIHIKSEIVSPLDICSFFFYVYSRFLKF